MRAHTHHSHAIALCGVWHGGRRCNASPPPCGRCWWPQGCVRQHAVMHRRGKSCVRPPRGGRLMHGGLPVLAWAGAHNPIRRHSVCGCAPACPQAGATASPPTPPAVVCTAHHHPPWWCVPCGRPPHAHGRLAHHAVGCDGWCAATRQGGRQQAGQTRGGRTVHACPTAFGVLQPTPLCAGTTAARARHAGGARTHAAVGRHTIVWCPPVCACGAHP